MECGVVVSENALVSEVSFGETSGGAAMAHGTLVAEGSSGYLCDAPTPYVSDETKSYQRMRGLEVVAAEKSPASRLCTTVRNRTLLGIRCLAERYH